MGRIGETRIPESRLRRFYNVVVGTELRQNISSRVISPIKTELQEIGFNIMTRGAIPLGPNGARPTIIMHADAGATTGPGAATGSGAATGAGAATGPAGSGTTPPKTAKIIALNSLGLIQKLNSIHPSRKVAISLWIGNFIAFSWPLAVISGITGLGIPLFPLAMGALSHLLYRKAYMPLKVRSAWNKINERLNNDSKQIEIVALELHRAKITEATIFGKILTQAEINQQLERIKPEIVRAIEQEMKLFKNDDAFAALSKEKYLLSVSVDLDAELTRVNADLNKINDICNNSHPAIRMAAETYSLTLLSIIKKIGNAKIYTGLKAKDYGEGQLNILKEDHDAIEEMIKTNMLPHFIMADANSRLEALKQLVVKFNNGIELKKLVGLSYGEGQLDKAQENHDSVAKLIRDDQLPVFLVAEANSILASLNTQINLLKAARDFREIERKDIGACTSIVELDKDKRELTDLRDELSPSLQSLATSRIGLIQARISELQAEAARAAAVAAAAAARAAGRGGSETPPEGLPPVKLFEGAISHYEYMGPIGAGGMGTAYKAINKGVLGSDNLVAIKTIDLGDIIDKAKIAFPRSEEEDKVKLEVVSRVVRFLHEYQIVNSLDTISFSAICKSTDTNIQKIFPKIADWKAMMDYKSELDQLNSQLSPTPETRNKRELLERLIKQGLAQIDLAEVRSKELFIVTDFVPETPGSDRPAKRLLAHFNGLLNADQLRKLFTPALLALGHAHGPLTNPKIVHRDLKPDNLLVKVTKDGPEIKIIDWGIAKDPTQTHLTEDGGSHGTPFYSAPAGYHEEGKKDPAKNRRIDIYSIGVIFYQLLTGEMPFGEMNSAQWNLFRYHPKNVEQAKLEKITDKEIRAVVARMLSAKPSDNFTSMEEVLDALGWSTTTTKSTKASDPIATDPTQALGPGGAPARPVGPGAHGIPVKPDLNHITLDSLKDNPQAVLITIEAILAEKLEIPNLASAIALAGILKNIYKTLDEKATLTAAEKLIKMKSIELAQEIESITGGK